VIRSCRPEDVDGVLRLWRRPVIAAHDPAVGFWAAAGYDRDPRVGRFVKTLEA